MKDFIDLKEFTLYDRAGKQYDFKEDENGEFDAWIGEPGNRRVYLTVSKERLTKDIAIGELRKSHLPAKTLSEWINTDENTKFLNAIDRMDRNQRLLAQAWKVYFEKGISMETQWAINHILREMEEAE